MTTKTRPWADTQMAKLLDKLISKSTKTQRELAADMGYTSPNVLSMMKTGEAKVPLDRVPAMAKALNADVSLFFRLALEQHFRGAAISKAISEIFGTVVSQNEAHWINALREASDNSDPVLTAEVRPKFIEFVKTNR